MALPSVRGGVLPQQRNRLETSSTAGTPGVRDDGRQRRPELARLQLAVDAIAEFGGRLN
jgi:hypothetical protein